MPRSCSDAFYFHLVYEYLVHMGMDATSRKMMEECEIYGYPIPYLSETGVSMEEINRLLQYFDDENCPDFFKEFEIAVPVNIQNTTDCRKLKLGLHVYFAVTGLRFEKDVPSAGAGNSNSNSNPRRNGEETAESSKQKNCNQTCPCKNPHCMCRADGGSAEEKACMKSRKYAKEGRPDSSRQLAHPCMATLLAFLERDGSELSKEPELLPYFALPFILDPEAHPHYEHLFKPPWSSNLRRWLWNFLISHRQASRVPELVLLLPDLHSALSHRAGHGGASLARGGHGHAACPSANASDHEICMNHVTSTMHGKQRLRQYTPNDRDRNKKAADDDDVAISKKQPVTFHPSPASDQSRDENNKGTGVAAELTEALESSVGGKSVDLKKTLENCSILFPELMKIQAEFVEVREARRGVEDEPVQSEVTVIVTAESPPPPQPQPPAKTVEIHIPHQNQPHTEKHANNLKSNVSQSENVGRNGKKDYVKRNR